MRNIWLMGFFLIILASCSATTKIKYSDVSYPKLDEPHTAYLGDRLLLQARGFYTDVLDIGNIQGKFASIKAGNYCRFPNSDEYFSFDNRSIRYINFLGGTRSYDNRLTYRKDNNEVCLDDMWSGCFDSSYGKINHQENILCSDPNSFQQIIEYNGKAGHILNFTYREFSNDRMRTPFTTNFTMDQSEGDTITYKGARLKVVKATNQEIVYSVLRNFNSAF